MIEIINLILEILAVLISATALYFNWLSSRDP